MDTALQKLDSVWKTLRRSDQRFLANGRKKLIESIRQGRTAEDADEIRKFLKRIESAAARSLIPAAEKLKIEYPEHLPISSFVPQIKEALCANDVIIVCGATGGKL